MEAIKLEWFSEDRGFPFYIQFGSHERDMSVHCHEDFSELSLVAEGTAKHIVNGCEYPLRRGDAFVIHTGTSHGFCEPRGFHLINIMFRRKMFFSSAIDISKCESFHALFDKPPEDGSFNSRLHLSPEDAKEFIKLSERMAEECGNREAGYQTALRAGFLELCVLLCRRYSGAPRIKSESDGAAAALMYMEDHMTEELSAERLADIAGLSVRQLSRVFVSLYGLPPMKYAAELRMDRARRLLAETDKSITEIAFSCGYLDSNYFSRVFGKKVGMTPEEYRGRHSGKHT